MSKNHHTDAHVQPACSVVVWARQGFENVDRTLVQVEWPWQISFWHFGIFFFLTLFARTLSPLRTCSCVILDQVRLPKANVRAKTNPFAPSPLTDPGHTKGNFEPESCLLRNRKKKEVTR
jgi:hypothetical protein